MQKMYKGSSLSTWQSSSLRPNHWDLRTHLAPPLFGSCISRRCDVLDEFRCVASTAYLTGWMSVQFLPIHNGSLLCRPVYGDQNALLTATLITVQTGYSVCHTSYVRVVPRITFISVSHTNLDKSRTNSPHALFGCTHYLRFRLLRLDVFYIFFHHTAK